MGVFDRRSLAQVQPAEATIARTHPDRSAGWRGDEPNAEGLGRLACCAYGETFAAELEFGLCESTDSPADLAVEGELLLSAYQVKSCPQQPGAGSGSTGVCVQAKVDVAGVEPFPDFVVHLALFEVPFQGAVVPTEDTSLPFVDFAGVVIHLADAYSHVQAESREADLQQHVAPGERRVAAVRSRARPSGRRPGSAA